jgi:hypothetical protein
LIISIAGGEYQVHMPSIWKKNFTTGLIRAAKTVPNTWIITGGLNTGVMKLVGDSIAEEISTDNVTVLGIAAWRKVFQSSSLEVKFVYIIFFHGVL